MIGFAFDRLRKQILYTSQCNELYFFKKSKTDLITENLKQTVAYVTKFNNLKYFLQSQAAHTL